MFKLGYVTRKNPKDCWTHEVLNVQSYKTEEFAAQIGLQQNNIWGIIRQIIDLCMGMEDGKYVLLKDPNKSMVRMYSVPWEEFNEDDDEEDEESDE